MKVDYLGRVRTSREQREALLNEFERSGLPGTWASVIVVALATLGNMALAPIREDVVDNTKRREELLERVARLEERSLWMIYQTTGEFPPIPVTVD